VCVRPLLLLAERGKKQSGIETFAFVFQTESKGWFLSHNLMMVWRGIWPTLNLFGSHLLALLHGTAPIALQHRDLSSKKRAYIQLDRRSVDTRTLLLIASHSGAINH
jgi:uncharacterized membrane protein